MSWVVWLVIIMASGFIVLSLVALYIWRRASAETKALLKRIGRLSFKAKLSLALALVRDDRIPIVVRAIPPALVLYLSMPFDLVPDFIPVLGQLDDVVVVVVGLGLLLRLMPRPVLEEHLARAEELSPP